MTTVNPLRRIIFYGSLATIILILVLAIVFKVFPFEIKGWVEEWYDKLTFYGLLPAIFLTLFGTIKADDSKSMASAKILLTCCAAGIALFILIVMTFAGMCVDSTDAILFQNKTDHSEKIVVRSFGCGATDSGPASRHISQIKEISTNITWVKDRNVDTSKLDKSLWERIAEPLQPRQ